MRIKSAPPAAAALKTELMREQEVRGKKRERERGRTHEVVSIYDARQISCLFSLASSDFVCK